MAHVGRLYERFARRDLSMKPGGYCYLPKEWAWSGLVHYPGAYQWFSNQTNILTYNPDISSPLEWVWEKRIQVGPGLNAHVMRYFYRITHDANMVEEKWEIGNPVFYSVRVGPRFVQTSFPFGPLPSTWVELYPTSWHFISLGTFGPKPW